MDAFETAPDALARELAEELGVQVSPPTGTPVAHLQSRGIDPVVWSIDVWQGQVTNLDPDEHDALGWFDETALADLVLAHPAYHAILSKALRSAGNRRVVPRQGDEPSS